MGHNRPKGPLGIDPLQFSAVLFSLLILFVLYLLLPRAIRKQYFGAYPKRHAWSARARSRRGRGGYGGQVRLGSRNGKKKRFEILLLSLCGRMCFYNKNKTDTNSICFLLTFISYQHKSIGIITLVFFQSSVGDGASYTGGSSLGTGSLPSQHRQLSGVGLGAAAPAGGNRSSRNDEHVVDFSSQQQQPNAQQQQHLLDSQQNDEIVISAAMQQLRDPGVLIVAHGSRGKPKTVRLQLTEQAITWRTETRKKSKDNKPKMGKLHQVPLSHIMYVDVGKQTTALRRVENASVSEALCFSLLTKEGSLDLEANSPRERDALVSCFSLVLDEVHAQNWRDIYRGPSSDMPSSFDELDPQELANNAGVSSAGQLHPHDPQQQQQQQQQPGAPK